MDKIKVTGGTPLFGTVPIGGSKNASLPIIMASLLTDGVLEVSNIPVLADIKTLYEILKVLGVRITHIDDRTTSFNAAHISELTAPYELVKTMRASVLVLGPLLSRFGECQVALPGGCAIGPRPVNFHLAALEQMGADISIEEGYIKASVKGRLKGANITFPKISVGATENTLMAATLVDGQTVINNAAMEPEITDLALCLKAMGADITGIGTSCLTVNGKDKLGGAKYSVLPDRIETATYMIAAAITGGKLTLTDTRPGDVTAVSEALRKMGVEITETDDTITVDGRDRNLVGIDIVTEPYPGFPTDVQAQIMALMLTAKGGSTITETIFENRFMHVPEMQRMNADIRFINDTSVAIAGESKLKGAPVMASDLRASAGLVLAALAAEGDTLIERVYHLDRGYEALEAKLSACGANIVRLHEDKEETKTQDSAQNGTTAL